MCLIRRYRSTAALARTLFCVRLCPTGAVLQDFVYVELVVLVATVWGRRDLADVCGLVSCVFSTHVCRVIPPDPPFSTRMNPLITLAITFNNISESSRPYGAPLVLFHISQRTVLLPTCVTDTSEHHGWVVAPKSPSWYFSWILFSVAIAAGDLFCGGGVKLLPMCRVRSERDSGGRSCGGSCGLRARRSSTRYCTARYYRNICLAWSPMTG